MDAERFSDPEVLRMRGLDLGPKREIREMLAVAFTCSCGTVTIDLAPVPANGALISRSAPCPDQSDADKALRNRNTHRRTLTHIVAVMVEVAA